ALDCEAPRTSAASEQRRLGSNSERKTTHRQTRAHRHTNTHTQRHTHIHTNTHTHTHTHTQDSSICIKDKNMARSLFALTKVWSVSLHAHTDTQTLIAFLC